MNIDISIANDLSSLLEHAPDAAEDLVRLTEIVKTGSPPVTWASLIEFFKWGGAMAIAVANQRAVGAADLILSRKRNGFTYRLEHVSVLPEFRGRGIAKGLLEDLRRFARKEGRHIDLSCEPSRVSANHLYESLGYKIRNTNSRRLVLSAD